MSTGKKIQLGKRLTQIESLVTAQYDHIWDCCCDHGLLGAALLARNAAPNIHFVDIAPDLMHELEHKLKQFFPQKPEPHAQWQVHCIDVTALPLQQFSGKHLVIIAGVGGDLMTELVRAIHTKNPACDIDFLLCPVHHQFTLRQQLIQLNFSLKTETLIVEKQRYYEILLVSSIKNISSKIHPVGNLIWQSSTAEQTTLAIGYLKQKLAHYRRMELNKEADVEHIIHAYEAITLSR